MLNKSLTQSNCQLPLEALPKRVKGGDSVMVQGASAVHAPERHAALSRRPRPELRGYPVVPFCYSQPSYPTASHFSCQENTCSEPMISCSLSCPAFF